LTTDWSIRDAADDDIEAITTLTNALLSTTTVEYTDVAHTIEGRLAWLHDRRERGFPVLVADAGERSGTPGGVVGFASYGDFRDAVARPGYRFTVEHTVHVASEWWGSGLGSALVSALIERARSRGLHTMVGAIDAENEGSIRFHQRLGFVEVARMPEVGHKFGRWLDLVLVQLTLDEDRGVGRPSG
jgi:L-amino acid N-acyltransferase